MIRAGSFLLIFLAVGASAEPAAQDARKDEEIAVQAFGTGHPECQEWGDGCIVCRRGDETHACSTPGIACTPQATTCRKPAVAAPKP